MDSIMSRDYSNKIDTHSSVIQKEKEVSQLVGLHACDSSKLVNDVNSSHGGSFSKSHLLLDGKDNTVSAGETHPETVVDEQPPEHDSPPASPRIQAESSMSRQPQETPKVGATETSNVGKSSEANGGESSDGLGSTATSVKLDTGTYVELGTAGACDGIPSLSFSNDETKLLADKIGHAIIGKFSHTIPSPKQIQKMLSNIQFVGGFKWKSMNAKHILIQFRDVGDYARFLNGPNGAPVWYVDNHPMRVFKWAPDFDTFFESPIATVWCNVIGLPIHLYEHSALLAIGKLLGKPILADHATINQTRLTFARICVEIDISNPPPEEIIINILGKDTKYKVVWDRIPMYCIECKHIGHVREECLALGKKPSMKDHNHTTKPRRTNSRPMHNRREWRPKGFKADNPTHQPVFSTASKNEPTCGPTKESNDKDTSTDLMATKVTHVHVDEDGFQLVSRRKKGKMSLPRHHPQEGPHKGPYLEKLLMGGNVATVSFGESDVGVIDPGGSSTVPIS